MRNQQIGFYVGVHNIKVFLEYTVARERSFKKFMSLSIISGRQD